MPKVYVVTAPPEIRGIYRSWPECERFQAVASEQHAEAMLQGEGTALTPGLWAFVHGNHLGGVSVVIVEKIGDEQESAPFRCLDQQNPLGGARRQSPGSRCLGKPVGRVRWFCDQQKSPDQMARRSWRPAPSCAEPSWNHAPQVPAGASILRGRLMGNQ